MNIIEDATVTKILSSIENYKVKVSGTYICIWRMPVECKCQESLIRGFMTFTKFDPLKEVKVGQVIKLNLQGLKKYRALRVETDKNGNKLYKLSKRYIDLIDGKASNNPLWGI